MVRASHNLRRAGFTLVEILMVVVILGIASAIIIPQISSRDDLRAAAGARLLVADLIYAQNKSIATQKMHYVKFDPALGQYTVLDDLSPENIVTHPVNQTPYITQFGANGPEGLQDVSIDSATFDGQLVIGFDELGTPHACDASAGTSVVMNSGQIVIKSGDFTLTVNIEPYTGEISVN